MNLFCPLFYRVSYSVSGRLYKFRRNLFSSIYWNDTCLFLITLGRMSFA